MKITQAIIKTMLEGITKAVEAFSPDTHCFAFEVCVNPLALNYYFIRYVHADLSDPLHIKDSYGYFCFNEKGQMLNCLPIFEARREEVDFYESFIVLEKYEKLP
ncbi:MAG TPA: hypothetical protein VF691_11100 [Cytophagaceae bacterium]